MSSPQYKTIAESNNFIVLEKFDILTHSISKGLLKKIKLRKKQYEYYREQLLMFNGK